MNSNTPKEHKQKTAAVVNHILKHLSGDLSLEGLAAVANYSPFHFQKIFTSVMGISPKQYVIKTRLETTCHFLIIQPEKPVMDIAMDCGFSSPAVFARAFRSYFGASAEQIRAMPQAERTRLLHAGERFLTPAMLRMHQGGDTTPLEVSVKKITAIPGVCINTHWGEEAIAQSLHDIVTQAAAHDLLTPASKIIGITSPHHNMYRAFVSIHPSAQVPPQFNRMEIKAGKYATFKTTGTMQDIFHKVSSSFFHQWLPASGYRLADVFGFELFLQSPLVHGYSTIEREFFIPIEPAR